MPQIIVAAGDAAEPGEGTVTLRERINVTDFESDRFAANLLERLGWAVDDAADVEQRGPDRPGRADELAEARASRDLVEA